MVFEKEIEGRYINLRAVCKEDAQFILNLRLDELKNKFIHKTPKDIELQEQCIERQRQTENDYYFLLINKNLERRGTISLYNITDSNGELGRWISYGSSYENLESVILLHDFAFQQIGLDKVYTRTKIENKRVVGFWQRFGSDLCREVLIENWVASENIVTKETYKQKIRPRMEKLLE